MNIPLISVIIPIYNAHDYLERCLDSAINQTLKDIEIICVDDCSKDNSLEILNDYSKKDARIKVIPHSINQGESAARNTGILNATGEFIAFLDNDDKYDLDFCEKLYNKAKETNSDISIGNVLDFDYQQNIKPTKSINNNIETNKYYFSSYWWRAIYKKDLITKNNIYLPEGLPLGGDLLFLVKAVVNAKKVCVVDNVNYNYFRRENSGDSKIWNRKKFNSVFKIIEMIIDYLNENNVYSINLEGYIHSAMVYATQPIYAFYHTEDSDIKKECAKKLVSNFLKLENKEKIYQIFKSNYPLIDDSLTQSNIEDLFNILNKYQTLNKFMIANNISKLRTRIK